MPMACEAMPMRPASSTPMAILKPSPCLPSTSSALATFQLTQAKLADMAVAVDASALLVYRAAWAKDQGQPRVTREGSMAKLFATESAQRVIDDAVQLFGGQGVVSGEPVERLYREIRALRIYEGTSEIQRLVIAGQVLAETAPG